MLPSQNKRFGFILSKAYAYFFVKDPVQKHFQNLCLDFFLVSLTSLCSYIRHESFAYEKIFDFIICGMSLA